MSFPLACEVLQERIDDVRNNLEWEEKVLAASEINIVNERKKVETSRKAMAALEEELNRLTGEPT